MSGTGTAYINPMNGVHVWLDGTHPGDPIGDVRVTAAQLNGSAYHPDYMQTNSLQTQQFGTGGAATGQVVYMQDPPEGDGIFHDGTIADLAAMTNFTISFTGIRTAALAESSAGISADMADNGGGLGNASTVRLKKNGSNLISATRIKDLGVAYDVGVTDLTTIQAMSWGIEAVAFVAGATYVRVFSLPLVVFFSFDAAPPSSVSITGSGGVITSGNLPGIGAGAGVPPELHGNQWGLLQFVMRARLEDKL